MFNKFIAANLDSINDALELDISVNNNFFVTDGLFFNSFRRVVSYKNKDFEIEEAMKPNRALNHLASVYRDEPLHEFLNFEWTSRRHLFLNDNNGYFEKGTFVATTDFKITMSWGVEHIAKHSRLAFIYSVEGFETGICIATSRKEARLYCPDIGSVRFINHTTPLSKVRIFKAFTSKRMQSKILNIAILDMIPSVLNSCLAGLTIDISADPSIELKLAIAISDRQDVCELKYLRVNNIRPTDLIAKCIHMMSEKHMRIAIKNVVSACAKASLKIPPPIAALLASSNKKGRTDEKSKSFICNTLDVFFDVEVGQNVVFQEKYGNRIYTYKGRKDIGTAKAITRNMLDIPVIKDQLNKLKQTEVINIIHEYIARVHSPIDDNMDSFSFGGLSLLLDYKNSAIKVSAVDKKHMTKAARWIVSSRTGSMPKNTNSRAKTYLFLFLSTEDADRALRSTYGLAIATLLDVSFEIKVFSSTIKGINNIRRYFTSSAFSPLDITIHDPEKICVNNIDVALVNQDRVDFFPGIKRKIVIVEKEQDADICFFGDEISKTKAVQTYSLPTSPPNKAYIYLFTKALKLLTSTYSDRAHAVAHLSNKANMDSFTENLSVEHI